MAYVLRDKFIGAIDGFVSMSGSTRWTSQSFTASSSYNIARVDLWMYSAGTPGTVTVSIRAASGDVPTGPDLASGVIDGNTITSDSGGNSYEIIFSSAYSLSSSTKYCIVVRPSAGILYWKGASITPNYTGGDNSFSFDSGSNWVPHSGVVDHWFETYEDSGSVVYAEGTKTVTAVAIVDYITGPGKAWNPGPTDDQEDIAIIGRTSINTLTWNTPTNETPDFLVYYRAEGGAWVLQDTITDDSTSYTLSSAIRSALAYYSIYEWRVDTREAGLTTTGDTWTFITQTSPQYTSYTRRSDYDADKVWQPGTGWVDPNTFEYTGGGRYKGRVLVIGHQVLYFGAL